MGSEKSIVYDALIKKPNIFHEIFKNNERPLLILHPKTFKIIDANVKAVQFCGYSLSELKRKHIYNLTNDDSVQEWKTQYELHKGKTQIQFTMPVKAKNCEDSKNCEIIIKDISISKIDLYYATMDSSLGEYSISEGNLKEKNKELSDQVKKMIEVNRRIVHSYDNVKTQYQELLDFQDDNVKAERKRTIGEMIEVLQDKINKPLNRILDDIQKIQDSEKKIDSSVVKRLKLIEESAENVLRLISRIAEIRDIKKMRYIELGNM